MEESVLVLGALVGMMLAYAWFAHMHKRRANEAAKVEATERSKVESGRRGMDWLPRLMWETANMRSGVKTAMLGLLLNAILIAVGVALWQSGIVGVLHPVYLIGPCCILAVNLAQFLKTGSMSMMDWFLTEEDRRMFGKHPP